MSISHGLVLPDILSYRHRSLSPRKLPDFQHKNLTMNVENSIDKHLYIGRESCVRLPMIKNHNN